MTATRIDCIAYSFEGDHIDLEQDSGCGEVDRVRLHRIHLQHLAREFGLFAPDPIAERTIRVLQRRLRTLALEATNLADWVRSGPDDDEEHFPDFLKVMALERLALALVDDIPDGEGLVQGNAAGIPVDGRKPSASDADGCATVTSDGDRQLQLLQEGDRLEGAQ